MYWRFYSLVGFFILFSLHPILADEHGPSQLVPNAAIETKAHIADLLVPAHDLLGMIEQVHRSPESGGADQTELPTTLTANVLASHAGPPMLVLPVPVQSLVGPWLSRLTLRDPPVIFTSTSTAPGSSAHFPQPVKTNAPLPRMDQVWRVAPAGALAQTYDGLRVDGGTDLGLEVHAGSTRKDRASNAIKGTASTQVSLLPESALPQWVGRYLGVLGTDKERWTPSPGPLRMVLATNSTYALNPSTKNFTSTGEVVGTLSWALPARERFTPDPWHIVAFRWDPHISCEGRSLLRAEQKTATKETPLATLTGNLRGDLRLDFLSPQLVASGNYHYGQRLTVAPTTWKQATVSWKYQLNTQVSLGGSFTHGVSGSNQLRERELKLEMGVTF